MCDDEDRFQLVGSNEWVLPFLLPGNRDNQSASHV